MTFRRSAELIPMYSNNGRHIAWPDFVDLAYQQWDGLDGKIKNIVINVIDNFGAKGDGVTDDTVAIQAAIDSCTNGGIIFFPRPSVSYNLNGNNLSVSNDNLVLVGENSLITNGAFVGVGRKNIIFRGLKINTGTIWKSGINFNDNTLAEPTTENIIVEYCEIDYCYDGVLFYKCKGRLLAHDNYISRAARLGITFDLNAVQCRALNNRIYDSRAGVHTEGVTDAIVEDNVFDTVGVGKSSVDVGTGEQPAELGCPLVVSNGTGVIFAKNRAINCNGKVYLGGNSSSITFRDNSDLGLVQFAKFNDTDRLTNLSVLNNSNISLYNLNSHKLAGMLTVIGNTISTCEMGGAHELNNVIFDANKFSNRILFASAQKYCVLSFRNNRVSSRYYCALDAENVFIEHSVFEFSTTGAEYPDWMGFRFDTTITKNLFLNYVRIKGNSSGNHIVLTGGLEINYLEHEVSGTSDNSVTLGRNLGVTKYKQLKSAVYGSAAPTSGTWAKGDIVYNSAPAASGYIGFVCVTAGTPGTWKGFGVIQA